MASLKFLCFNQWMFALICQNFSSFYRLSPHLRQSFHMTVLPSPSIITVHAPSPLATSKSKTKTRFILRKNKGFINRNFYRMISSLPVVMTIHLLFLFTFSKNLDVLFTINDLHNLDDQNLYYINLYHQSKYIVFPGILIGLLSRFRPKPDCLTPKRCCRVRY